MQDTSSVQERREGRERGILYTIPPHQEEEDVQFEARNLAQKWLQTLHKSRCKMLMYIFVLSLLCVFLVVPFLMLYIAFNYTHCKDIFTGWLLLGGILWYITIFFFFIMMITDIEYKECSYIPFGMGLMCILCWWISSFVLGSMKDPLVDGVKNKMDDPVCRLYLYTFPFWLSLAPFALLFIGCIARYKWLCELVQICFCDSDSSVTIDTSTTRFDAFFRDSDS